MHGTKTNEQFERTLWLDWAKNTWPASVCKIVSSRFLVVAATFESLAVLKCYHD